jgi:CubicO group peptidase (beta-lactamase class C family)
MKHFLTFVGMALLAVLMANCNESKHRASAKPQMFAYIPDYKALGVDESRLARIDTLLQSYVDQGILPHAQTFIAKDGEVIHNKSFGWKDVDKMIPLQRDDIFRMYSQTKAITTVALMTLFEEGKFQLDDPVSKYIPEMTNRVFVNPNNPEDTTTRAAKSPVLIRHLLSHSSGIGALRKNGHSSMLNGDRSYATLKDYVKDLVKQPLLFDPGTGWNYHISSDVWAYLVEYFSGESLQDYLQKVIFEPLGIKDMAYYYADSAAYKSRFVNIYVPDKKGKLKSVTMWSGRYPFSTDRRFANGGTGLNGTIEGYARFCQMILNGGTFNHHRVLGRRTIEVMTKNQLTEVPESSADYKYGIDPNFHFGIGFQIYPYASEDWNTIPDFSPMVSAGSLYWGGMANTDYIIDRKENMIILLYTNRIPDTFVWEKFLNTVYQALK